MIRNPRIWSSLLLILPAACSAGGGNNAASSVANDRPSNAAGAAAPAANVTNAAGASAAPTPGPCPFETRNWRATLDTSPPPEPRRMITIRGEVNADSQGRYPNLAQQLTPPPDLVLNVENDPRATPQDPPGWADMGIGYDYDAAYTHAVVRCNGREIARVPVPRG
jgi:hypothetical protein